jgi:sugar/nucleoside kinase (ribokinase family)
MSILVFGGLFREVLVDAQGGREIRFAGSALYAAAAAARLGAAVTMLAPVGSEDVELAEGLAAQAGINAEFIVAPGASGTFAYERRRGLLLARGYRPADSRSALEIPSLDQPEIALFFGHPEYDPSQSDGLGELVSARLLLFDRQGWMSATPSLSSVLRLPASRHISLANVGELGEEHGGMADFDRLPPDGFATSIAKDGRWGVHLLAQSSQKSVPAYRVDASNELGSGDVFAGALAADLLTGVLEGSAIQTANAAAAVAVSSSETLPGQDFALRVRHLREAGATRAIVPPGVRAQAGIYLDSPSGLAGDILLERLRDDLGAQGFAPSLGDRTVGRPRIRLGDQVLELEDSTVDPLDWLSDRLSDDA